MKRKAVACKPTPGQSLKRSGKAGDTSSMCKRRGNPWSLRNRTPLGQLLASPSRLDSCGVEHRLRLLGIFRISAEAADLALAPSPTQRLDCAALTGVVHAAPSFPGCRASFLEAGGHRHRQGPDHFCVGDPDRARRIRVDSRRTRPGAGLVPALFVLVRVQHTRAQLLFVLTGQRMHQPGLGVGAAGRARKAPSSACRESVRASALKACWWRGGIGRFPGKGLGCMGSSRPAFFQDWKDDVDQNP